MANQPDTVSTLIVFEIAESYTGLATIQMPDCCCPPLSNVSSVCYWKDTILTAVFLCFSVQQFLILPMFIYPSRINLSYVYLLYLQYTNHILKWIFEFLQISNVSVDLVGPSDALTSLTHLENCTTCFQQHRFVSTRTNLWCKLSRKPWLIGTYDQFDKLSVRGDGFFYPSYHNAEAMSLFQCFDHRSMRFLVPLQKVIRLHD